MKGEYTRDEMLGWLKKHYSDRYKVETYSDEFLPVRVPLYCRENEIYLFGWGNIPGGDSEKLRKFLKGDLHISWVKNADISKTEYDKIIIVSAGENRVELTHHKKSGEITLKIDGERVYNFEARKGKEGLNIYKSSELIIEITTEKVISKENFFPQLPDEEHKLTILEASPVRFYQYYFPKAKIFFAYPDYVTENDEFNEFKKICVKRGIGLLKTSSAKIEEVVKPRPLFDEICKKLLDNKDGKNEDEDSEDIIGNYLENFLHYIVYYPAPVYRRRAIIGRMQDRIGYTLIDKLSELKNISSKYRVELHQLWSKYRLEERDDYEIAIKCISDLWRDRLGLKYPEIHRHLEEILMRDEMYREHFVHQFQVFLIGAYILDKLYKTKDFPKVIKSFEEKYKCKIEDVWLAASTYHDFNYGLQNFDIWLLRFFSDTLSIKDEEAKQNLNLLNLDATMVREFLSDIIRKLITFLDLDENTEKKARKFFYEKVVRDRNHGALSALSILKLCEMKESRLKVSDDAMLQAAFAIACHDEDIWEALSGCKGYLKSNFGCEGECNRELWKNKEVEVHKQNVSHEGRKRKCEIWEQKFMEKAIVKKIKFDKYPILFLLIFCDSVQEEGRVTGASFSNAHIFEDEKEDEKIDVNSSILNNWVNSKEKLGGFDQAQANEIKDSFSKKSYKLSNTARIYKHRLSDKKWKIVDVNIVYIIEYKIGVGFFVKVRRKECSLSEINVDPNSSKIKIDLAIDGLVLKLKELERVSWVLKDERFSVHLEEKDTEKSQDIIINGSGGG